MRVRSFFRTPKGQLLLVFAPIIGAGIWRAGLSSAGELLTATVVAAAIDMPILRARTGKWSFPSGAIRARISAVIM